MITVCRTRATASRQQRATARTSDGALGVRIATPKERGGRGGRGASPEHLLACGYAAFFLEAMRQVAGDRGVAIAEDTSVTADVGVGRRDDGRGLGLDIGLVISLPGLDPAVARALVSAAHGVCPMSHATRGTLAVRLTVS